MCLIEKTDKEIINRYIYRKTAFCMFLALGSTGYAIQTRCWYMYLIKIQAIIHTILELPKLGSWEFQHGVDFLHMRKYADMWICIQRGVIWYFDSWMCESCILGGGVNWYFVICVTYTAHLHPLLWNCKIRTKLYPCNSERGGEGQQF